LVKGAKFDYLKKQGVGLKIKVSHSIYASVQGFKVLAEAESTNKNVFFMLRVYIVLEFCLCRIKTMIAHTLY